MDLFHRKIIKSKESITVQWVKKALRNTKTATINKNKNIDIALKKTRIILSKYVSLVIKFSSDSYFKDLL